MPSSTTTMLSNFRKRYPDRSAPPHEQQSLLSSSESDILDMDRSDPSNDAHRGITMADTGCVAGCTCDFCGRTEIDGSVELGFRPQNHGRRPLPSTRSIMQVLYPASYLGIPCPFPDPPSYSSSDSSARPPQGDDTEDSPLISTAVGTETSSSPTHTDPLAQHPALTGVPTQGVLSSGTMSIEPSLPTTILGEDVSEETELLPAYSRFDQRRPRFPVASDVLGPYPPLPVFRQTAP